jgi:hypothetical protein
VWTSYATVNNLTKSDDNKTIYRLTKRLLEKMEEDLLIQNILKHSTTLAEQ